MDGNQNRSFIQFEIKAGDLVLIKNHIFSLNGDEEENLYGVVLGKAFMNQITLFPEVKVYLFKTKRTRNFVAGTLEIISHA